MKAGKVPAGNVPAVVHASGHLLGIAPGLMEGDVSFPVRGKIKFTLRRTPDDHAAKLICPVPYSDAGLAMIRERGEVDYWHGSIAVEGYTFRVRAQRDGKQMAITFFDTDQVS